VTRRLALALLAPAALLGASAARASAITEVNLALVVFATSAPPAAVAPPAVSPAAGVSALVVPPPPMKFHLRPTALFSEHLYEGTFLEPVGVSFDPKTNEVWVADTKNNLIGAFTPEGVPLFTFGSEDLHEPVRVATDPEGRIYVLDNDRSSVKVFSYRGEPLGPLTLPGAGDQPAFTAMAFDADGNLYLGESESCRVLVYSPDLKPRQRFGSCGVEQGQFQAITGIAADKDRIVVTDAQGVSVQVFDKHGEFVRGWGKHDMGRENFSLPQSVALDSTGRVIVIDALRHEIKFFDGEGNFLDRFGGLGSRLGQVAFPTGIAVDASDRLYVVEKGNQRVQVFVEAEGDFPPDAVNRNQNTGQNARLTEEREVPRNLTNAFASDPGISKGLLQQPVGGNK
jgi:DNA-binding beta-propeller fold protein YncE